jgi:phospholipid/cholesterol/gamma-HCH transport system ATP-binding protein
MTEPTPQQPYIEIRDITMAYGSSVIQRDLNFTINQGDIFVIMGGSGCGKSTLLKHMLGLIPPSSGDILYSGTSFFQASAHSKARCASAGVSPTSPVACSAP